MTVQNTIIQDHSIPKKSPMVASLFTCRLDNVPKVREWEDFSCFAADLLEDGHDRRLEKDGLAISLVSYEPNTLRGSQNVKKAYGISVDLDGITPSELSVIRAILKQFVHVGHTTYSHTLQAPCVRFYLPFASPISPAEYAAAWAGLDDLLGHKIDPATKDVCRISYTPAAPPDAPGHWIEHHHTNADGTPARRLDPRALIRSRTAPATNAPTAPLDGDMPAIVRTALKKVRNKQVRSAIGRMLDGKAFAKEGERDDMLWRMAIALENLIPAATIDALVSIFQPSLEKMAALNPHDHLTADDVRSKLERARAKNRDKRILRRADQTEVAMLLSKDLEDEFGQMPVYDLGNVYRYEQVSGIWNPVPDPELARMVMAYTETCLVPSGSEAGPRPLRVNASFVDGVIKLLKDHIDASGFFADAPRGLAFTNGYLAVKGRSLQMEPHSPENRVTVALPFPYEPTMAPSCERWLQFLYEVFLKDEDADAKKLLLQEYVGACLLATVTRYAKALVLIGTGRNGKSVFLSVISALFPPQARACIPPQDWEHEYRRAALAGVRLNCVSELPRTEILRGEAFKAIVAGDPITGRFPYQKPFTITPVAGHLFAANHLPGVDDMSKAFWERFLIVEFNRYFAEEQREKDLDKRLIHTELAGIAAWAIEGAARLLKQGEMARLTEPASHAAALHNWRDNTDQVAMWLADNTVPMASDKLGAFGLQAYEDYSEWAEKNGHRRLASNKWSERLKALGIEGKKIGDRKVYPFRLRKPKLMSGKPPKFE